MRTGRPAGTILRASPRAPGRRREPSPALLLVVAFGALIAIGTLLLALPIASADGRPAHLLVALFTATSAACVTGLVVVDTATAWSGFGQAVILLLIQLGGLGIATGSTFLLQVLTGGGTRLRDRMIMREAGGVPDLGDVSRIVRRILAFTVAVEVAGACILALAFLGRGAVGDPLAAAWWGLFHAVSSFNNAGFDLTGGFRSLIPFAGDPAILVTIGMLTVTGGVGYAIVADLAGIRTRRVLALETRLVLTVSLVLLGGGALAIGLLEWGNPATLGALPPEQRPLNALFQSAVLRSSGFASVDIGGMLPATLLVAIALMFVGGASGGTAGGIKVTTAGVLVLSVLATIRGSGVPAAFGRRVDMDVVARAFAVAFLSLTILFGTTLLLAVTTHAGFLDVAVEAASALGTVGVTTGITPRLEEPALLVLVVAMLAGRLGPLTLAVALAARRRPLPFRPAEESVRIG